MNFPAPVIEVDRSDRVELRARELQTLPLHIFIARGYTKHVLGTRSFPFYPVDDPFQYAHVLAEAGPYEFAIVTRAKPIDREDFRRPGTLGRQSGAERQ